MFSHTCGSEESDPLVHVCASTGRLILRSRHRGFTLQQVSVTFPLAEGLGLLSP